MTALCNHTPPTHATVTCIICFHFVSIQEVTAGSLYADGQQAFACNAHLVDRARWITAWALFDQRQEEQSQVRALVGSAS
jgi:hypothetical protein